jgi:uncharacterized membrane protein (UPF0182 family)
VLLVFILHGVTRAFEIYVKAAWMRDLGYEACYWTEFWAEVVLFWIAFLVAGSFLFLQARLFFRLTPTLYRKREALCWTIAGSVLLLYIRRFAWNAELFRSDFLLFLHRQPFGKIDPVFSHDLGFYIFTLPVIQGTLDQIIHLIWIAMLMTACAHGAVLAVQIVRARFGKILSSNWRSLVMNALFQLAVIGWAMLAAFLLEVFDKRYKILYSTHGHVYGAGWADLHVRIPAYWCFVILSTIVLLWLAESRRN